MHAFNLTRKRYPNLVLRSQSTGNTLYTGLRCRLGLCLSLAYTRESIAVARNRSSNMRLIVPIYHAHWRVVLVQEVNSCFDQHEREHDMIELACIDRSSYLARLKYKILLQDSSIAAV